MSDPVQPLIEVKNLKTWFPIRTGVFSRVTAHVKAVDGVSFQLGRKETLGLVGESGCGKTTVGRSILKLVDPTEGSVRFDGQDVLASEGADLRRLRKRMQIIFQDPYGSLNPRMTVGSILSEGPRIHQMGNDSEIRKMTEYLMDRCGLDAVNHINRYPHEFSGGQRQRIGIARALSVEPEFIVCDEAVSALDVSIQAQIINLLLDLQDEFGLSYLFIAHDLAVVEHISDRVAVMYLGKIVEEASSDDLYSDPRHPYTKALLSAVPEIRPGQRKDRIRLEGDVPSPIDPPPGCTFHTRCPSAGSRCRTETPRGFDVGEAHRSHCWLEDAGGVEGEALQA
ncbi:MAG: dipeptide ABC transporter ATP-binding protein [Planctomycetota bacterium]|nr:dipeptide ABC transporter ATP-binding protein [Planctomycetota bacterium]